MPTILRFRNFRIMIYTDDHTPAHVHAMGPGRNATFFLNCRSGPITLRSRTGTAASEEKALMLFLADNLEVLCQTWEDIHDRSN